MPRSFESTSRKRADKLIREFNGEYARMLRLTQKLRELRPYSREAYLRALCGSPKHAAHIAWLFFRLGSEPLGELKSAALNLGQDATYEDASVLLEEFIASRGWTEKVGKLLAEKLGQAAPSSSIETVEAETPANEAAQTPEVVAHA